MQTGTICWLFKTRQISFRCQEHLYEWVGLSVHPSCTSFLWPSDRIRRVLILLWIAYVDVKKEASLTDSVIALLSVHLSFYRVSRDIPAISDCVTDHWAQFEYALRNAFFLMSLRLSGHSSHSQLRTRSLFLDTSFFQCVGEIGRGGWSFHHTFPNT